MGLSFAHCFWSRSSDECTISMEKMAESINALDNVQNTGENNSTAYLHILFAVRATYGTMLIVASDFDLSWLHCAGFANAKLISFFFFLTCSYLIVFIVCLSHREQSEHKYPFSTWDNKMRGSRIAHSIRWTFLLFFLFWLGLCSHPLRLEINGNGKFTYIGEHWTRKKMHESTEWMEEKK